MAFSSGLMDKQIIVRNRKETQQSAFGVDGNGIEWQETACLWADVTWAKGTYAMHAGALDAYGVILVRTRWTNKISMHSQIKYNDMIYQILPDTFHPDKRANTLQFHAQIVIND